MDDPCDRDSILAAARGENTKSKAHFDKKPCSFVRLSKVAAHDENFGDAAKLIYLAMQREPLIEHEARALFVRYSILANDLAPAARQLKKLKHPTRIELEAKLALAYFAQAPTMKTRKRFQDRARAFHKERKKQKRKTLPALLMLLQAYPEKSATHQKSMQELLVRYGDDKRVIAFDDRALTLSFPQRLARIEVLMKRARYTRALYELQQGLALTGAAKPEDGARFKRLLVEACLRTQDGEGALRFAKKWRDENPKSSAALSAHAWILSKLGLYEEAAKAHLARKSLDPNDGPSGCFFAGFALYEAQEYSRAAAQFDDCRSITVKSNLAAPTLWYLAFTQLLLNNPEKALPTLERLVKSHRRDREVRKHKFFLAHTLSLLNEKATPQDTASKRRLAKRQKRAKSLFTKLYKEHPLDYYGLRARFRLELDAPKGVVVAGDAFQKTHKKTALSKRALTLYDLGFDDDAKRLARTQKDIALSAAVGDGFRAYRRGPRYFPRPALKRQKGVVGLNPSAGWRASFQTPYGQIVDAAAKEHAIESALIYAIMRTESGFKERAQSPVGALGLLQLMPYTARGLATKRNEPVPAVADLTLPAISIDFGASFLALSQQELGHPWLAAAGYNASPENVAKWLHAFSSLDSLYFVERVPFKETRNYIKRVSATMAVYRALEGAPLRLDAPQGFSAPAQAPTWFPRNTGDL